MSTRIYVNFNHFSYSRLPDVVLRPSSYQAIYQSIYNFFLEREGEGKKILKNNTNISNRYCQILTKIYHQALMHLTFLITDFQVEKIFPNKLKSWKSLNCSNKILTIKFIGLWRLNIKVSTFLVQCIWTLFTERQERILYFAISSNLLNELIR